LNFFKKVALGLVAFRSNTAAKPGVEYASKVLSNLRDGRQRDQFERALSKTTEAEVSTHAFNEDAFAGLKTALEKLNWQRRSRPPVIRPGSAASPTRIWLISVCQQNF
jgi:hypothetical protein